MHQASPSRRNRGFSSAPVIKLPLKAIMLSFDDTDMRSLEAAVFTKVCVHNPWGSYTSIKFHYVRRHYS